MFDQAQILAIGLAFLACRIKRVGIGLAGVFVKAIVLEDIAELDKGAGGITVLE